MGGIAAGAGAGRWGGDAGVDTRRELSGSAAACCSARRPALRPGMGAAGAESGSLRTPSHEPGLPAHLRALVSHRGAAHSRLSGQDLRCRRCGRTGGRRQTQSVCPGPRHSLGDGHQVGAGAWFSAPGERTTEVERPRIALSPGAAHHRRGGARLCARGGRATAFRNRSGVFAGLAEHADGECDGARGVGKLPHGAPGGHRRRGEFHAQRRGAPGRRAGDSPRHGHRRDGVAVAFRFFAHR